LSGSVADKVYVIVWFTTALMVPELECTGYWLTLLTVLVMIWESHKGGIRFCFLTTKTNLYAPAFESVGVHENRLLSSNAPF
jgi:hypothetical protein